jgi:PadR family transcriptional regulator PadR
VFVLGDDGKVAVTDRNEERNRVLVPRNYLHACLLLLIAESPAHGYDLLERLAVLGLTNVDSGTVYRALRTLNADGLVESWWEASHSGPGRRRYRISQAGMAVLDTWAAAADSNASCLNTFVARHRWLRESALLVACEA